MAHVYLKLPTISRENKTTIAYSLTCCWTERHHWGGSNLHLMLLNPPSFHWSSTGLVKNSQKYIADPPPCGFTTNRVLITSDILAIYVPYNNNISRFWFRPIKILLYRKSDEIIWNHISSWPNPSAVGQKFCTTRPHSYALKYLWILAQLKIWYFCQFGIIFNQIFQNLFWTSSSSSSFSCSINSIRQTFIPQPLFHYSITLSPFFFTNVSAPISVSSCAHTSLLNTNKAKQRLSPLLRRSQSGTRIIDPIPRECEFRIKSKETDCSVKKRSWKKNLNFITL